MHGIYTYILLLIHFPYLHSLGLHSDPIYTNHSMKITLSLNSIFCMGVPPPSAAMRNFLKILTVILVFFLFISILFTFQGLSPLPLSSFKQSYAASHNTTTKDYSVGLTKLRSLYLYFALVYLCFLGCWIFVCFKNYPSFH